MSTTDQAIASDLAALAADNKIRIPPLDVMLRAPAGNEATVASDGVAMLAASRIYVRRFARAAAGAAALACALALVAWLSNPLGLSADMSQIHGDLEQYIVYIGPLEVVSWSALVVLMTYIVATRIAERRVARRLVTGPSESLTTFAIGLRVAGTAGLVITIAMSFFANGLESYCDFWAPHDPVLGPAHAALVTTLIGTLLVAIAVAVLARHASAAARVAHSIVTVTGVSLGLATVVTGSRLDVGPKFATFATGDMPSLALRIVLTITGSLAVLIIVASGALRRHRREELSLRQP